MAVGVKAGSSRRTYLARAGALAGFGGLSLAACGAPGAGEQKAVALNNAPVTIRFYKRGTISEPDVETMLTEWKALHPTWTVELTQGKNSLETLAPHIAGGDKIDVLI